MLSGLHKEYVTFLLYYINICDWFCFVIELKLKQYFIVNKIYGFMQHAEINYLLLMLR